MADNVTFQTTTATPPSGTVVSTEEVTTLNGGVVTAQQVQRVAIALRTGDGTAIDLPGTSANGLDVDVTRIGGDVATTSAEGSQVDGHSASIGATDDAEAAGDGSVIAILKRIRTLLAGTLTATISGVVSAAQSGTWNITNITGTVSLPTGASTATNQSTIIGHLDGVEGLLTTIDADTSTLAGAVSGAAVNIQDGGNSITVDGSVTANPSRPSTASVSSVADSATNQTLLSTNANRLGATVFNDSTVDLYLKLGATATTSDYTVKMAAGSYFEVPYGYTGRIDGIWASDASGSGRITELT